MYVNKEYVDNEIKNVISFTTASKKWNGCKYNKIYVRLLSWNYIMLMKEIKENMKKWGEIPCQ